MPIRSVRALRETQPNVSLVERLVAAGLISERQLRRALQEKRRRDQPLGEVLLQLGMISERVLNESLGRLLGDEEVDLHAMLPDPHALAVVTRELAERHSIFPLEFDATARLLTLAATQTLSLAAADEVSRSLDAGVDIATVMATESDIRAAIGKFYGVALLIPDILRELDNSEIDNLPAAADPTRPDHPLNRLVDAIIVEAARRGASAIYLEPEFGFLRVRFRIDGVLAQAIALHPSYWPGMAARLTAMFDSPGDEPRRLPEGWMSATLGTRALALQLARQETARGHDFVLRIIARDQQEISLQRLGLGERELNRLRLMLARPDGLVIVAGPPRSGKTTTLCAMLSYRSDDSVAIVALLDSPDCCAPLIRPTSIGAGSAILDAARCSASAGEVPDVLALDELRDESTAALALRTAMMGRPVFATLTASSALAALSNLRGLGLRTDHMAGTINGIVAQRLVRKLCTNCRQTYTPQPVERAILGAHASATLQLYREGACEHCNYMGYKGLTGLFEILPMNETLDDLLANGTPLTEMQRASKGAGDSGIVEAAIRQVMAGVTSLSEASRVVDLAARIR